jgi:hypothetical protein
VATVTTPTTSDGAPHQRTRTAWSGCVLLLRAHDLRQEPAAVLDSINYQPEYAGGTPAFVTHHHDGFPSITSGFSHASLVRIAFSSARSAKVSALSCSGCWYSRAWSAAPTGLSRRSPGRASAWVPARRQRVSAGHVLARPFRPDGWPVAPISTSAALAAWRLRPDARGFPWSGRDGCTRCASLLPLQPDVVPASAYS